MLKQMTEKILAMGLMMGAAMAAHAAPTYTLACETSRGQSFTLVLRSFSFKVSSSTEAGLGMAAGKRSNSSELVVKFPVTKEYDTLLAAAEENEMLRNCRLTVTTGTIAAADDWNQMSSSNNKKNKTNKGSNNPASSGGTMEWTFNNGTISALTAIGTDGGGAAGSPASMPEALVEATIAAQNFVFVMK